MEEYLTVNELSQRIKIAKQTIYNLIHKKIFVQGKHYEKPMPKKILFKWSEVRLWIERDSSGDENVNGNTPISKDNMQCRNEARSFSLLNI